MDEVKKHNRLYGKIHNDSNSLNVNLETMFEYITWISNMDTLQINFYEQMNLNINTHRINKQPAILVSLHIPQLENTNPSATPMAY